MTASYDVIIVGAGIVGAACASEAARGGLKTLVIDRGRVGGGTTAAGMGHVAVMDDSEAEFRLMAYSRKLWLDREESLPPQVEFDRCGALWIASDDDEFQAARSKHDFYAARGIRSELLDSPALREAEPNLRPDLAGGLRIPDDPVIYPPCAAAFLIDEARRHGAEVRLDTPVKNLRDDGAVELGDGSVIPAGANVNAAGCWSPQLTAGLPVRKRKGHLVITDRYPGFFRHEVIELGYLKSAHTLTNFSVAFNIQPRKNGQMLIGSSRQFDADDTRIEPDILGRMIARAVELSPKIASLSAIRAWTGHRPATPDKLPLIGPAEPGSRRWLATGHEGLGITTSLATGRLLVDQMLGRRSEIAVEPYLPERMKAEG